jgi:WD40 repeat protein
LEVLRTWTTTPPELDQVLIRHGGVRFFPDGKSVVSWGDLTADVRDAESGAPRYAAPHHEGRCFDVDFSPDGKFLATAGYDRTARVWDAATGRPAAAPLVHAAPVYRVRFAPGGGLITDCLDGAVHVWDWKAGRATTEAKTPKYAFVASASPDGRWLLAGCDGESLRLLSLATGEPVAPAVALSGAPWTVEISADGKYAAVAGSGSAVDVVDLSPLDAVAQRPADAVLRAELTSGLRIVDGELKPLTPAEWFQRWAGRERAIEPPLR